MRLAVVQRGARTTHDVEWTLALGGDGTRVDPDGGGAWRGQFTDHGTYRELRIDEDSLPTQIDGKRAGRYTVLSAGMAIAFGDVRILVEYDGPLAGEPPLTGTERELLQRIAEGDDGAALVLADHWGDARGAFITTERAGHAGEPPWLGDLRTAGFAGLTAGGFAVPLALDPGEPLGENPHRLSPRCYRLGAFADAATRALVFEATGVGPARELGAFALQVTHVDERVVARTERIIRRFAHPHLVRYAGPVQHRRGRGFAMHWAGRALRREQFGDPVLARDLGLQLCAALRALAAHGVAHGAIEPSHVMLDGGRATLIGFGNAIAPDVPPLSPDTRTGTGPSGLFRYRAPERLRTRDEPVVSATDLFSLAGLLVEIATGHHPFGSDDDPMLTLQAIVQGRPVIAGFSPIEQLARATLVVDPAQRPTLDAFEAALR